MRWRSLHTSALASPSATNPVGRGHRALAAQGRHSPPRRGCIWGYFSWSKNYLMCNQQSALRCDPTRPHSQIIENGRLGRFPSRALSAFSVEFGPWDGFCMTTVGMHDNGKRVGRAGQRGLFRRREFRISLREFQLSSAVGSGASPAEAWTRPDPLSAREIGHRQMRAAAVSGRPASRTFDSCLKAKMASLSSLPICSSSSSGGKLM